MSKFRHNFFKQKTHPPSIFIKIFIMNALNNFFTNDPLGRRHFLGTAGKGLLASNFLGSLYGCTSNAQQVKAQANMSDNVSVKLPPLDAPSEVKPQPVSTNEMSLCVSLQALLQFLPFVKGLCELQMYLQMRWR